MLFRDKLDLGGTNLASGLRTYHKFQMYKLLVAAILGCSFAAPEAKRNTGNVVEMSLNRGNTTVRKQYGASQSSGKEKRFEIPSYDEQGTTTSLEATTTSSSDTSGPTGDLNYTVSRYFLDYEIAGQKLTAILDTGSTVNVCFLKDLETLFYNAFDPSKSSTYEWMNNNFTAAYGTGSNKIAGTWAKDTVTVGGASVDDYQFAMLNKSVETFEENRGIFGLSLKQSETSENKYPTFPERLKSQGTISSNSFSLYTADPGEINLSNEDPSAPGKLLFGGVDLAKCDGPLYTVPWSTTPVLSDRYYTIDTEVNGVEFTGIWDTGTAEILLPEHLAESVAHKYGYYFDLLGSIYIKFGPTNMKNQEGLTFNFSGVNVTVPAEKLVVADFGFMSILGVGKAIQDKNYTLSILGDPIMRQLNLVFDIDNKQYGISNIKHTSDTDVQAVTDSIPGSVPAPGA